jgi:hypothetical protein
MKIEKLLLAPLVGSIFFASSVWAQDHKVGDTVYKTFSDYPTLKCEILAINDGGGTALFQARGWSRLLAPLKFEHNLNDDTCYSAQTGAIDPAQGDPAVTQSESKLTSASSQESAFSGGESLQSRKAF